jgi:hypothetical protein
MAAGGTAPPDQIGGYVRDGADRALVTECHRLWPNFAPIADLARRRLVVVERHGQAQIIRFCANVTPRVKPDS